MRSWSERGIALISVLLVMMLVSALLVGFASVVISDQRYRFIDRDHGQAFYGASAGIEKLTADLGDLFDVNIAPTTAQITALTTSGSAPTITGVAFSSSTAPGILPTSSLSATNCVSPNAVTTIGANGYTIKFCAGASGDPASVQPPKPIKSGPYEGLIALQTPYQMDVTARTSGGGEVHLVRSMEAVAIPVFQFGMFSDVDQSFFAGPNFNFGGRVHTNGTLFLAQGDGTTLTLSNRVTAVKEIVRQVLQNGVSIAASPSHLGTVDVAKAAGSFQALQRTEGSTDDPFTVPIVANVSPSFLTTSSAYNYWLRNGDTGAKPLNLALLSAGGSNPDLLRRPSTSDENVTNAVLFRERLFTKASLRILLSDTAANITGLPGVTSAIPPVLLDGDWNAAPPSNGTGVNYGPIDLLHPPVARTTGPRVAVIQGGASTVSTYDVADVTPFLPTMTLAGTPVICTGKTNTTFTGCNVTVIAADPSLLAGAAGITPVSTTGAPAIGVQTLTVTAGNTTSAFNPLPFWFGNNLVTCTGWDATTAPPAFTGCAGAAAAPPDSTNLSSYALSDQGTGLIGGYIKIERQNTNGSWTDVTMEILNHGIGARNIGGTVCADPTPDAIVRLQRLRDNGGGTLATDPGGGCAYASDTTASRDPTQVWPNVLFDPREALERDTAIAGSLNLPLGGVMHYVSIDVGNLSRWFSGTLAGTGASARTENGGFTVYLSDRRNNRNAAGQETGEYGWEDFVNPASATGAVNGVLDAGEDLNASAVLDIYGSSPSYGGVASSLPPGATAPFDGTAGPWTLLNGGQARVNRAILFRRALKLTNAQDIRGLGITGLTIVSENPVYIQGNWNASGPFAGAAHAATAVISDAVTLLTSSWRDTASFASPYNTGGRARGVTSWYRLGIIAGKGLAFPHPAGTATDFGTDGGAHNFLRYLQGGNNDVNYLGSIATFYYNRQAVGTYKCCSTVYDAPTRNYNFDTDFLNPALLPPNTPVFRDLNTVGFAQEMRPGR